MPKVRERAEVHVRSAVQGARLAVAFRVADLAQHARPRGRSRRGSGRRDSHLQWSLHEPSVYAHLRQDRLEALAD